MSGEEMRCRCEQGCRWEMTAEDLRCDQCRAAHHGIVALGEPLPEPRWLPSPPVLGEPQ